MWLLDEHFDDRLLDDLLVHSCSWLKGYFEKNPQSKDDKDICDGINIDGAEAVSNQTVQKVFATNVVESDAAGVVSMESASDPAKAQAPKETPPATEEQQEKPRY